MKAAFVFWELPGGSGLCSVGVRVSARASWARGYREGRGQASGAARRAYRTSGVTRTSALWPCPCSWGPILPNFLDTQDSSRGESPQGIREGDGGQGWGGAGCPCRPRLADAFWAVALGRNILQRQYGTFSFIVWGFSAWKRETPPHPTPRYLWHPLLVRQSLKSPL